MTQAPERIESEMEHIARDIREGIFPKRSERKMVKIEWDPYNCPFCNSMSHVSSGYGDFGKSYWVECLNCRASGPDKPRKSESITAWNTRTDLIPRWRPIDEWDCVITPMTAFYNWNVNSMMIVPEDATHFMQLAPPSQD